MQRSHRRRSARLAVALGAAVLAALGAAGGAAGVRPRAAASFQPTWSTVVDPAAPIAQSSPVVADLSGTPAVVVGDLHGLLHALSLATGHELPGWPVQLGAAIESSPSTSGSTVFVGVGSAAQPNGGGYDAVSAAGTLRWSTPVRYQPSVATHRGVVAGLTVGLLGGRPAVVGGSLGQFLDALSVSSGRVLPGFPWFQADTVFSTAALADLYGKGLDIVEGGDSTAGNAFQVAYRNGGHLRILSGAGNVGAKAPSGGLVCQYDTDQVVQSSPAVGPFLAGRAVGVVAGTGTFYAGAFDTDRLLAIDTACRLAWSARLDGSTSDSPALVDALGNGRLQVAEGTSVAGGTSGTVYLLDGATGKVIWSTPALGPVVGGITSVDLGSGYQDLVVPTLHGVELLDGRTGAVVDVLETVVGVQGSPLVTDDPNGTIGITVAGYKAGGTSPAGEAVVEHFELPGSDGARVTEAGSWPEFHHDPQLTGNADG